MRELRRYIVSRDLFNKEGTGHITGPRAIGFIWCSASAIAAYAVWHIGSR